MPLIVPRATGTILDSPSLRFLSRTSLELSSLQAQDEHVLNQWLESQLPPSLEQALHDLEHALDDRWPRCWRRCRRSIRRWTAR